VHRGQIGIEKKQQLQQQLQQFPWSARAQSFKKQQQDSAFKGFA